MKTNYYKLKIRREILFKFYAALFGVMMVFPYLVPIQNSLSAISFIGLLVFTCGMAFHTKKRNVFCVEGSVNSLTIRGG